MKKKYVHLVTLVLLLPIVLNAAQMTRSLMVCRICGCLSYKSFTIINFDESFSMDIDANIILIYRKPLALDRDSKPRSSVQLTSSLTASRISQMMADKLEKVERMKKTPIWLLLHWSHPRPHCCYFRSFRTNFTTN